MQKQHFMFFFLRSLVGNTGAFLQEHDIIWFFFFNRLITLKDFCLRRISFFVSLIIMLVLLKVFRRSRLFCYFLFLLGW